MAGFLFGLLVTRARSIAASGSYFYFAKGQGLFVFWAFRSLHKMIVMEDKMQEYAHS